MPELLLLLSITLQHHSAISLDVATNIQGPKKSRFGVVVSRNGGFSWGHAEFELLPDISVDSQEDAGEILRLGLGELGSLCSVGNIYTGVVDNP